MREDLGSIPRTALCQCSAQRALVMAPAHSSTACPRRDLCRGRRRARLQIGRGFARTLPRACSLPLCVCAAIRGLPRRPAASPGNPLLQWSPPSVALPLSIAVVVCAWQAPQAPCWRVSEDRQGGTDCAGLRPAALHATSASAVWSSGMILAPGARGPGFNSQNSPLSMLCPEGPGYGPSPQQHCVPPP